MWCSRPQLFLWGALLLALVHALRDDGKTAAVQWDRDSLLVNGTRLAVFSGEFHYPRLPVPQLWPDIFEKLRAAGFNAVSIYFFWAYHSTSPAGPLDFTTGARNVQLLLDQARAAGVFVVARPGPYINAETTAGGVALWTTTGAFGSVHDPGAANHDAWLPYIRGIGEILARNGVDRGGPVLLVQHDNEFPESPTPHVANSSSVVYMEQISAAYDAAGVTVPSSHNEVGMRAESWSTDFEDVGGAVNVYGLDSYPQGFDCSNPAGGFSIVESYFQWFQNYSFTQPSYLPEFQGGSFDPWAGAGYDNCAELTGTNFSEVFYKNLISQKVTLVSFYMSYGGTNWGSLAAPVVYTSYDYGAGISEGRLIRDKLREQKLLGLWLRVSSGLLQAAMIANGTGISSSNSTGGTYGTHLRNPEQNAGFYWMVQQSTSSQATVTLSIELQTSLGNTTVSGIELAGRQSKFAVTDYAFGAHVLLYSTAEILTFALLPAPTLILYLNAGQRGEFVLKTLASTPTIFGASAVTTANATFGNATTTKITYTQAAGKTVLQFPGAGSPQIWLVDRETAYGIWAPALTANPIVAPDEHLLVAGPYLVRSAALSGATAALVGDLNETTVVELAAPANVTGFSWNGAAANATRTPYGTLTATLPGPAVDVAALLPDLSALLWRGADALPERFANYSDVGPAWVLANHTTTANPTAPLTLPVLYADDYGFHAGYKLWRGYFSANATGGGAAPTSANLTLAGGTAFGFSVFLNGAFLGSFAGDAATNSPAASLVVGFGNATLAARRNVLVVLSDYNGHGETGEGPHGPLNPRGILGATLDAGGVFDEWRVAGNAGGEQHPADPVRGVYNEGGLHAERVGWHLPGAPTQAWPRASPLAGLAAAGVAFYVAELALALPAGLDVPLAVRVAASAAAPARVQLYVNGYQYARYASHIGPQTVFPIPPGVLNVRGNNTLAVSLWAMDAAGARLDALELVPLGVLASGFAGGFAFDAADIQPPWTPAREAYA